MILLILTNIYGLFVENMASNLFTILIYFDVGSSFSFGKVSRTGTLRFNLTILDTILSAQLKNLSN